MTGPGLPRPSPRPTLRTLLVVGGVGRGHHGAGLCGLGATLGVFVAVMVVLGIAQRIAAVAIVRRRGERPSRWWGI